MELKYQRILILSEYNLIVRFLLPTFQKLKAEKNIKVDCFLIDTINPEQYDNFKTTFDQNDNFKTTFDQIYTLSESKSIFRNIPKLHFLWFIIFLGKNIKKLPFYDYIHINYHHYYFGLLTNLIRNKCKNYYITFFGSDFNEINFIQHWLNRRSVLKADGIFASNRFFLEKIVKKYKIGNNNIIKDKLFIVMKTFDMVDNFWENHTYISSKKKLGINRLIITCAYNAAFYARHKDIINTLHTLENNLTQYKVIFPMTYGYQSEKTKRIAKSMLNNTNLDYLIIEEYLSMEQVLMLRQATDIFISLPSRDQIAGSMLEHLTFGSIVITGKWLPYDELEKLGVFFIRIESVKDLKATLNKVLNNLEYFKRKGKNK